MTRLMCDWCALSVRERDMRWYVYCGVKAWIEFTLHPSSGAPQLELPFRWLFRGGHPKLGRRCVGGVVMIIDASECMAICAFASCSKPQYCMGFVSCLVLS